MKNRKKKVPSALTREINFLEAVERRCPRDIETMKALAELYTNAGRYEEGLKYDRALADLCPQEPLVWYNLACSYAMLDNKDDAFNALAQAIDLGYSDHTWLRKDKDLESIRKDMRFNALLRKIKA